MLEAVPFELKKKKWYNKQGLGIDTVTVLFSECGDVCQEHVYQR